MSPYRRRIAGVMHIVVLDVQPKHDHKQEIVSFPTYFACIKGMCPRHEDKLNGGPWRLGGGRGKVKPPHRSLYWTFWRFGGFVVWLGASTLLEARRLGGFAALILV